MENNKKLVSNEPGVRFVDDHIISIEGSTSKKAAYEKVVGVGAIDINGDVAEFSAIEGVDVWAPGVDSYSTEKNDKYVMMDGTSMASSHWIKWLLIF